MFRRMLKGLGTAMVVEMEEYKVEMEPVREPVLMMEKVLMLDCLLETKSGCYWEKEQMLHSMMLLLFGL